MPSPSLLACHSVTIKSFASSAETYNLIFCCKIITFKLSWIDCKKVVVNTLLSRKIVLSFDHQVCFLMNIFGKRSDLPFSRKSDRKKNKSVVSFTHEQNIICSQTQSQTQFDDIVHEQTIICRQLFAGHVVGFRPMTWRKNSLNRMIMWIMCNTLSLSWVILPTKIKFLFFLSVILVWRLWFTD